MQNFLSHSGDNMDNEQILTLESFRSGWHDYVDTKIPDDAFSAGQNIDLGANYMPVKSNGHYKYNAGDTLGANPTRGGYLYVKTDGTRYYVFACGGKIYYSVAGSGTFTAYQIGGNDLTIDSDSDVEMVQYLDSVWIVNGKYPIITNGGYATSRMIKISGTTVSEITKAGTGGATSSLPQGGKYIIEHQERLFIAGSIDSLNGLYWCQPFDPEDWAPEYGLNYDYVGKDDGEIITGAIEYQGFVVVVKPRNIYRYSTVGDITQWRSHKADTHLGCLYHRTLKEFFGRLIYLSAEGVVLFSGNEAEIISDNIEDTIANLPQLKTNIRQWLQSITADFDTGIAGAKLVDTSDNELKAIPQTSNADWNAGTKTQVTVADDEVKITLKTGGITGNLALNKTATANDSDPGLLPSNVNDGNINSYWWTTGPQPTAWWKVDLGSSYLIRYIKSLLIFAGQTVYIQGSTNDVDWITLATLENPNGYIHSLITEGTYRYIRFYIPNRILNSKLFEVEVYSPYYDNGNIITQSLDFGFTPAVLGNLAAEITIPSGTTLTFQTRTSPDNSDWSDAWQNIGSAGENNGAINSTARRYIQWKAIFNPGTYKHLTPILHQGYIGVTYWSVKKDLGAAPASWGKLESAYATNGQTIEWWMRSATTEGGIAAATWYQQTAGNTIVTVVLKRWVQYSIRLNSVLYSGQPKVDSVQINYYTGAALLSPCAIVWKDYYKLNVVGVGSSVNDVMYQYNKEGYWLPPRVNKKNNIYFIDEDKLVSGTSESDGFIRINDVGTQDDTTDIDSWFETKKFERIPMTKIFRKAFVTSQSDNDWILSYSVDGEAYTDITISLQPQVKTVPKVFTGIVRGEFIKFKVRQNSEDVNWEFHKTNIFWTPWRELNIS